MFFSGGGLMGERMRGFDWGRSALGASESWPCSLRAVVRLMLDSRHAMWMLWGEELSFLCNDACLPMLGRERDGVLGIRADAVWQERWADIGPRVREVLEKGESSRTDGQLLFLERGGFPLETYHRSSYVPLRDDCARLTGVLCTVDEVTDAVLAQRRLHTLQTLGAALGVERARTAEEACRLAVSTLAANARDIPWAAALALEHDRAQLLALAGADAGLFGLGAPSRLDRRPLSRWPLQEARRTRRPILIEGTEDLGLRAGAGTRVVSRACAIPVAAPGHEDIPVILLVGLSPSLHFDAAYREFLDQCAFHLARGFGSAPNQPQERNKLSAPGELERAKARFFSNVSHEFLTPLTLMLGPIEDALKDPHIPAALQTRLHLIHQNSLRLLKLVNSLLDFSRLEAGLLQPIFEPTDLAGATRAIASSFQPAMTRAGLSYRLECEALDELVFVDRDLWEKIILHLLSNAFKFTLEGTVIVGLRREGDAAVLEVIDTGVGVPEFDRVHLFERFHRIESTRGRTSEGSGIGLAIVQELVRLHGGTVGFRSAVGHGTTFFVRVPFGSHHLPLERVRTFIRPLEPPALASAFVREALRWLPEPKRNEGAPGEVVGGEYAQPDRRFERTFGAHVLIADDNADMRAYLRELLCACYVVETVGDGETALECARRRRPDLILSDVMMPRLGGVGLLRAVRSDERLRTVPVVLLSARADEEAHSEALEAGADDYLIKPFSARELSARLGALLELKQLRAAGEQRMQIALTSAHMVTWDWELKSNRIQFSTNAREVLGADWSDRSYARTIIHPDDWSTHQKAIREAVRTRGTLQSEIRMRRPDTGELRCYQVRGQVECDSSGEARAMYGATVDVTDRKRMEETLRDMDRRKDEFLAMIAHELRNPLAPIQTGSELLERNFHADDSIHGIAAMVKRQVAQLAHLVDDLLDVSRITQGRIELKREPLELSTIVDRGLETVMPLLREKKHRLESIPSIAPLYVRGDMARLVQALANLLSNAAKYTARGGLIRIEVRRDRGFGVIEVRDDGIGISGELLPRVFELFVQGDRTLDRSQGGLGIGLSVVKRLVEMHGGTVTAASEGDKMGSTFTIRLPLIAEPLRRESHAVPPPALALPCEPRRVLVIDDNVDAADSLCMLLKVAGHAAEAVYGARDALERLGEFHAEAALVDIGLPDMNGYDLARQIRARSGRIQLIALTGYGQQEDFVRSREAGFDAHMIKPVEIDAVEAVLARGRPLN
jgi:signal transduction histidine kinase/DNA-binding response OmpR family regulator